VARYAIVTAGKVENFTEWDGDTARWRPPAGSEAVALADGVSAGIGWTYDGRDFTAPAPAPVRTPVMTTLDFLRLFTPSEVITWNATRAAMRAMSAADYADPGNAALAQFSYFDALFVETSTIDTSRADLQAGLDLLIAIGVIAADRKSAIIAGETP